MKSDLNQFFSLLYSYGIVNAKLKRPAGNVHALETDTSVEMSQGPFWFIQLGGSGATTVGIGQGSLTAPRLSALRPCLFESDSALTVT